MSAIVTTVLRGTIGLLLKEGRQSALKKLRDGDVAEEQLRSWIVDEMDNVNSKLDAMARKDLGASISHFKQGVILLNKAMNTKTSGKDSLNVVPAAVGRDEDMKKTSVAKTIQTLLLKQEIRRHLGPGSFSHLRIHWEVSL